MEPERSWPWTQQPTTYPFNHPDESILSTYSVSLRSILILTSHLRQVFPMVFSLQVTPPKLCFHISPPAYVPHALPLSASVILFAEEQKALSLSLCSFPPACYFSFVSPKYFASTLSLCSSINVRDRVSHTYNKSQNYAFCTWMFMCLDSKRKDKGFWTEKHR
jgi:hypothetical protein